MKAISIKQPWASLIVHGKKDIENRTWACPKKYIGQRVLIHASAKPDEEPCMIFNDAQSDAMDDCIMDVCGYYKQTGCIIGSVEIVSCVINHPSIWVEQTENYTVWDFDGLKEVKIECPECESMEVAVEEHTTEPFSTYLHSCNKCGYVILENE